MIVIADKKATRLRMTEPAVKTSTGDPTPPPMRTPSRKVVIAAIVAALCLTTFMIASIGWRWYHVSFPDSVLRTYGEASADGVEIIISTETGREIARGKIESSNQHAFSIVVEHGLYVVRARIDNVEFLERHVNVPPARPADVLITVPSHLRPTSTTAPAFPSATDFR